MASGDPSRGILTITDNSGKLGLPVPHWFKSLRYSHWLNELWSSIKRCLSCWKDYQSQQNQFVQDTFSAPPLTTNSNPGKLHSYCLLLATSQLHHVFASPYPETEWFVSHVRWILPHHCTFTWKWMTRLRLFPSHVWQDFAFLPALPECDSIPISTWTSFAAVVSTYKWRTFIATYDRYKRDTRLWMNSDFHRLHCHISVYFMIILWDHFDFLWLFCLLFFNH